MDILEYSERGILSSLLYEIKNSRDEKDLLEELFSMILFHSSDPDFDIYDVKILLGQSFSDFGDSDVVILYDNQGKKSSMFIEASIDSNHVSWRSSKEFKKFESGLERSNVDSSNLFVRLYHKAKMMHKVESGICESSEEENGRSKLSPRIRRRIGKNEVVRRGVDMLGNHCDEILFIALVPDELDTLEDFYRSIMKEYSLSDIPFGETGLWGFISWEQVENFCRDNDLEGVVGNFKFNRGIIQ